jgi:hypothetical protein
MHPAVQGRVIHMWMSAQTSRSVRLSQVQEVQQLLQHKQQKGQSSGAKTSTLWDSSCVMQHQGLLMLLDGHSVEQVSAGHLQVKLVPRKPPSGTTQDAASTPCLYRSV